MAKRRGKTKSTKSKLGIKGKLRKAQTQLAKKLEPVQRLRQRVCALNLAESAGRKTVSKAMRRDCAQRYPLKGGAPMNAGPMPAMPAPRAMPAPMPAQVVHFPRRAYPQVPPLAPSELPAFYD